MLASSRRSCVPLARDGAYLARHLYRVVVPPPPTSHVQLTWPAVRRHEKVANHIIINGEHLARVAVMTTEDWLSGMLVADNTNALPLMLNS